MRYIYGQENDCMNFVSSFNEDRINFSSFHYKKKKKIFEQTYRISRGKKFEIASISDNRLTRENSTEYKYLW